REDQRKIRFALYSWRTSFGQRPKPNAQRTRQDERDSAEPYRHIESANAHIDMSEQSPQVRERENREERGSEAHGGAGCTHVRIIAISDRVCLYRRGPADTRERR